LKLLHLSAIRIAWKLVEVASMSNPLCDIGTACLAGDAVYYPGSSFFIDPDAMTAMQLFWAFLAYGYVLFISADMIGDGAELLLLIPEYKDLVASIVLPILGAVPDGMMVLFSGIGPLAAAQENVAVGIGSLAGSTIMLLTLPWVLSFFGGKVDFENGSLDKAYDKKKSARDTKSFADSIFGSGVEFESGAQNNAKIMMLTCLAYFAIQVPALMVDDQKARADYGSESEYIEAVMSESSGVHTASLAGIVLTVLLLAVYLALQVKAANQGKEEAGPAKSTPYSAFMPATVVRPPEDGWLLEKGMRMHLHYLRDQAKDSSMAYDPRLLGDWASKPLPAEIESELRTLYKCQARKCQNKKINEKEMHNALQKIGLNYAEDKFKAMFVKADKDRSKTLEEDEFVSFFSEFVIYSKEKLPWEEATDEGDDDDDEMPDEFKDMDPKEQRKAILSESFHKMIIGTILVLIFSDPMVDVLGAIGKMTGVPAFYVAFLLAPLASNASELVASFKLASKKTKESITQSLQTLEGAAIMNNTYCLGIFYALIYVQGLAWKFTAETCSIVLVQLLVGAMVLVKKKQSMLFGIIVFSFYPLSLVLVAVLEANGID
jgi:Ca2+/Na+ antiporter